MADNPIPAALMDSLMDFVVEDLDDTGAVWITAAYRRVPPLAEYWVGEHGCAIIPMERTGKFVYLRRGWPPAGCDGWWLGQPEPYWNISDAEWQQFPLTLKALRECREQAYKWVPAEFDEQWLQVHYPLEWLMVRALDADERGDWPSGYRASLLACQLAGVLGPKGLNGR